jgi:hypothetical protein
MQREYSPSGRGSRHRGKLDSNGFIGGCREADAEHDTPHRKPLDDPEGTAVRLGAAGRPARCEVRSSDRRWQRRSWIWASCASERTTGKQETAALEYDQSGTYILVSPVGLEPTTPRLKVMGIGNDFKGNSPRTGDSSPYHSEPVPDGRQGWPSARTPSTTWLRSRRPASARARCRQRSTARSSPTSAGTRNNCSALLPTRRAYAWNAPVWSASFMAIR